MITILDEIKRRLQVWHEQRANRIEAKRQAQLDAEASEAVQVMEFNGELYISVDGRPLFNIDIFNEGYRKYKGLKGSSQYKQFKEIYSIDKENMILQKNAKLKNLAGMRDVS